MSVSLSVSVPSGVLSYSAALTLEPNYLKALLRRAQAHEAIEKYEDALGGVYGVT